MAKKQTKVDSARSGQYFVVGPRGGGWTFRSSTSGAFSTRVMSNDAFDAASRKANTAIREALAHPPKVEVKVPDSTRHKGEASKPSKR